MSSGRDLSGELLEFIAEWKHRRGDSPVLAAMAEHFGVSARTVGARLCEMAAGGLIHRSPNGLCITITEHGRAVLWDRMEAYGRGARK